MTTRRVALAKAMGWTEIAMRPVKAGFYDAEALTGIPPVGHIDEWKRQRTHQGLSIYWELPDLEHDVAACLAALDATGVQWVLRNHDDVTFQKVYQCEIDAIFGDGATPAEAAFAALAAWYKVEVE